MSNDRCNGERGHEPDDANGERDCDDASVLRAMEANVADLIADERGAHAAVRAWPRLLRFALVALVLAALAAFFWTLLLRADHASYPRVRFLVLGSSYALVALAAAWHALRPIWLPPAPRWLVRATLIVGLALPFVAVLLPELPSAARLTPTLEHHARWTTVCWSVGGLSGLAVLLLARALDRGGHRGTDHALFAALAAGMASVGAGHLECAVNFPLHLLLGHALVPLVFLGVARWMWRARP